MSRFPPEISRPVQIFVILAAALLAACAPGPATAPSLPEPFAWVDSLPAAWSDEPVVVLADSSRLEFDAPAGKGSAARARQVSVKWYYIRRDTPPLLRTLVVHDVEFIEEIPSVEVRAWRREQGRWAESFPGARFTRVPYDAEGMYFNNHYVQQAQLKEYKSGMLLRVRETHDFKRPEFLGQQTLRGVLPVFRKVVSVSAPRGLRVGIGLRNREGLAVRDTVVENERGSTRTFSAAGLPAQSVLRVPRPETWYAAVYLSAPLRRAAPPDWVELGDHYLEMARPFLRPDTGAASLARRIVPDGAPPAQVAESLFAHMRRNFRYHADERSIHAFVPRAASHTLRSGWGDCKELASLFVMMARDRGLEARLALVSTEGVAQAWEEYPTLGNYDHVIAAWKDGNAWRFVDATVNYGDAASSAYRLIGQSALLLDSGASRLTTVAPGPAWRNKVTTRSEIAGGEGGWRLQGTVEMEGELAHRVYPFLRDLKGEETSLHLNRWLQESFGFQSVHGTLRALDWNRVEIGYATRYDRGYLQVDKGGWMLEEPKLLSGTLSYTSRNVEGPREYRAYEQVDIWKLPEGFTEFEDATFDRGFAKGRWFREPDGFRREFRQEHRVLYPSDSTLRRGFVTEQQNFMRKTAWKP